LTRILYITQWYRPESEGPPVLIAEGLMKRNYEIGVITGAPNYPSGKIFPGYSAWKVKNENMNGIQVRHVPIYPSHDNRPLRRIINYLSFSISALFFGFKEARNSDLIIVYSSPATAAIPALFFKFIFKKPLILYIQDLWPDVVLQTEILKSKVLRKIIRKMLEAYDGFMLQSASQVIVISVEMKQELLRRGLSGSKIECIYNWANEEIIDSAFSNGSWRSRLEISSESLVLLYGGNLGLAQSLDVWLRAFEKFRKNRSLYLILAGEGVCESQLKKLSADLKLERVIFIEKIPLFDFASLSLESDAMIISLSSKSTFEMTIPGKVQACLALGRPVLASVRGSSASLLLDSEAAFLASPDSIAEIEGIILQATREGREGLRKKGTKGRYYYLKSLGSKQALDKIEKIISEAISGRG
jgi:colanic acid biosynthesis glycosyl transferase WcaI